MRRETESEKGKGKGEGVLPVRVRLGRIWRRIVGAPDYQAYLDHCRAAGHEPRLSEREYLAQVLDAKGRDRCC
jgi:uncharacterized short protein YbdD (DUF466 family)